MTDKTKDSAYWADKNDPLALKHGRDKWQEANDKLTAIKMIEWIRVEEPLSADIARVMAKIDPDNSWLGIAMSEMRAETAPFCDQCNEMLMADPYDLSTNDDTPVDIRGQNAAWANNIWDSDVNLFEPTQQIVTNWDGDFTVSMSDISESKEEKNARHNKIKAQLERICKNNEALSEYAKKWFNYGEVRQMPQPDEDKFKAHMQNIKQQYAPNTVPHANTVPFASGEQDNKPESKPVDVMAAVRSMCK